MPRSKQATRGRAAVAPAPVLTSAMVALAWSVLNHPQDRAECAHVLAELIIEAAESTPVGPGRP